MSQTPQAATASTPPPDLAKQWRAEANAVWDGSHFPRNDGEIARRERAKVLRECADEFEQAAPHIAAAERDRIFSQLAQHQHITEAVSSARWLPRCCPESDPAACHSANSGSETRTRRARRKGVSC